MNFDIFREYSLEEQLKMERYRQISAEIADMRNEKAELEYEYECIQKNKSTDFIPITICTVCIIPVIVLFVLDLIAGAPIKGSGLAIALASGLPILFIIFGTGIFIYGRKLLLQYSSSVTLQAKAKEKGVLNIPARRLAVLGRLSEIKSRTKALESEKSDIEIYLKKMEEENQ